MDKASDGLETKISEISNGGSTMAFKDGSKWQIAPYFKKEVFELWRHGDRVTSRDASDDPGYPYTIFNWDGNSEVAAKRIN